LGVGWVIDDARGDIAPVADSERGTGPLSGEVFPEGCPGGGGVLIWEVRVGPMR